MSEQRWREYCEAIRPVMIELMLAELEYERRVSETMREIGKGLPVPRGEGLVFDTGIRTRKEHKKSPFYRSPWLAE